MEEINFNKIKPVPIKQRKFKFNIKDMIPLSESEIKSDNENIPKLAQEIILSNKNNKPTVLLMGAHSIKLGLSNFIIDLMKKGLIQHIAMNGAGPIHDFEIALIGGTSEDVAEAIKDGSFGVTDETGHYINKAAKLAQQNKTGLGYEIGKLISTLDLENKEHSILYNAYKLNIPLTVHTAIGTEIIYQHPECSGAALGESSYTDFKILTKSLTTLEQGVVINLGSAIILPEVFLKTFTNARNLGHKIEKFTAANLDMIDHYRPRVNILQRPTSLGGKQFMIKELHEKSVPTLHHYITKN